MVNKIIFITGPVRSGKSSFAVELAKGFGRPVTFIATGSAKDEEMRRRINLHKKSRPSTWQTIEEPINLVKAIKKVKKANTVVLDCLTLWMSNQLLSGANEKEILENTKKFITAVKKLNSTIIIVSNEIGWGIVPDNKLARSFRDVSGNVHKEIAKISDEAYLVVSGIPMKIK